MISDKPADYLDREGLLAIGLDEAEVERLLNDSPITGPGGRPVVEADFLSDRIAMLDRERRRGS